MAREDEDDTPTAGPTDTLFVYGKSPVAGDDAYSVLRKRGESVELGALRGIEEGKPIHGELVRLNRRAEHPLLFDVDVLHDARPKVEARPQPTKLSGPPQVATEAYREGWELIFGEGQGGDGGSGGLN